MARYTRDYNTNRGYGWNRGRWGGPWSSNYDSEFSRGRFARRGGRFGGGYGSGRYERGGYGSYFGRGFGRTDFNDFERRFGGYEDDVDTRWGRGYDRERWGSDFSRGHGRGGFRESGLYGGGMYGHGTGEGRSGWHHEYDRDLGDRLRSGWRTMKRRMGRTLRGYDSAW